MKEQIIMKIIHETEKMKIIIKNHDKILIFDEIKMSKHKILLKVS
jgi:hypothetical protein